jgi:isopentenyl-diphosphate delta-isomerase type 1
MSGEWFDLVDETGQRVGKAPRSACHGDPTLLHQAVHVFVFNHRGELFLQKRSARKDVQPGKWDTSVGGHVGLGEEAADAARREMAEELGIAAGEPALLYQYLWRSTVESELIRSYRLDHEGPFRLQADEIDDGRFWSPAEIERCLGQGVFTPNFEFEWPRLRRVLG